MELADTLRGTTGAPGPDVSMLEDDEGGLPIWALVLAIVAALGLGFFLARRTGRRDDAQAAPAPAPAAPVAAQPVQAVEPETPAAPSRATAVEPEPELGNPGHGTSSSDDPPTTPA